MRIREKDFSFVLIIIFLLLVIFICIATYPYKDKTAAATIIIYVLSAVFVLFSAFISFHNHQETVKLPYKEKQLKLLYLPLQLAFRNLEPFKLDKMKKYSYLASGELKKYIDDYIKRIEHPVTFRDSELIDLDAKVKKAVDDDIVSLRKDLDYYIEI